MHRRPVIGIPTQTLQSLGGIPAEFPPSWVMSQRYILTLTAAGALPWMIPLVGEDEETLRGIYEELDGVFLPGGADIDPCSYSEERHPLCDRTDTARDAVELTMIRWAMADRKPVLGVCRGVQLINLAAGGTLYQDLADQCQGSIKHDYFPFAGKFPRDYLAHEVEVAQNTKLAEIIGAGSMKVNSMHHQGIRRLGGSLLATAVAPDGLIEAAESTNGSFLIGVQWHPEAMTDRDERMRRLFDAFVEASGEYRATRMVTA
jgi:putative glutamine amidotransferase